MLSRVPGMSLPKKSRVFWPRSHRRADLVTETNPASLALPIAFSMGRWESYLGFIQGNAVQEARSCCRARADVANRVLVTHSFVEALLLGDKKEHGKLFRSCSVGRKTERGRQNLQLRPRVGTPTGIRGCAINCANRMGQRGGISSTQWVRLTHRYGLRNGKLAASDWKLVPSGRLYRRSRIAVARSLLGSGPSRTEPRARRVLCYRD